MKKDQSIAIIGAGIVGCSIAYGLAKNGYTDITVIERNSSILDLNQSTTNEGTIHSGIYYPKDIMPLKARLCVEGNALLYEFLEQHNIPHIKNGKLIVATNEKEEEYLDFFLEIARENSISQIEKISGQKAKELEPNLGSITAALLVPTAGCTSPIAVLKNVVGFAEANGVVFCTNTKVTSILPSETSVTIKVETPEGEKTFEADILINAAGLYSDEIARMINPDFACTIDPARGEFYQYDKTIRPDVMLQGYHIYQPPYCYTNESGVMQTLDLAPDKLKERLKEGDVFITAGVHLSPTYEEKDGSYVLGNRVTISPLKTTGLGKEDYSTNLHPASDYIQKIHSFFPNLKEDDITFDHTGIMSPLIGYRDFIIEKDKKFPHCIQLVGMESPAWTAFLAIANHVATLL